jgi:hypothetical protein
MTTRIQGMLSLALVCACGIATQTMAATVTDTVDFSATGFTALAGSGPLPTDPVTGSFTITFDPTQTYTDATAGITLNGLNIAVGSQIGFDYSPTGSMANELVVGGIQDGVCCLYISPTLYNDFYLHITNFTTTPTFQQLGYSTPSGYWYTTGTAGSSVTVTPVSTSAPEIDSGSAAGAVTLLMGALMVLRKRLGLRGGAAAPTASAA